MHKLFVQLRNLPRTFRLVWEASGKLAVAWIILLVAQGLLPIATVYLTRELVNSLVEAVRTGGDWLAVRHTLVIAVGMGCVVLVTQLLRSATVWVRAAQAELVRDHISGLIHKKSASVDLAFYESPDFYDHLHRARAEATFRPVMLIDNVGSLLQNGITLVAMTAILIPFGPVLPFALILSTMPAFYVAVRASHRRHEWNQKTTVEERKSWYYDWLLTAGENAAELRLFGLGDTFSAAYQATRQRLRKGHLELTKSQGLAEIWAGLLTLLVSASALAWVVWRAIRGAVSLGDLALFYQAFNQGLGLARSLLENIGQLYENSLFLGNLFEFLALEPKVVQPAAPVCIPNAVDSSIEFRGVSFRYPGTDRFALREFDLKIRAGQIVAIVGPNGAGKSTLLKLLCRFYDPEEGSIELDGMPVRKLSIEELRSRISVLFQTPVRYSATAAENIWYGDIAGRETAISSAAQQAGASAIIESLPNGYDTLLGKWFVDGTELSVGEWQRIALARCLMRPAPILILDEPTSAMDPWAEVEWAEHFREAVRGRVAIIITHRFTTAMFADVIHVIADGQVVESGTHDALLRAGGLYAQGWAAQEAHAR
ncbi:MAG TPA: ABC transporter ATP-binding protein [Terriglobales bacterium]|nr:ABC transporter ATP-binding protein [Terriglobales bacterium]